MSNKAIYRPNGRASEYSYWACNFYTGCSNACEYCYCKSILRGIWQDKPTLKKCFRDEVHAIEVFWKELVANVEEIRQHGLFFSFTTDPMLPETKDMTMDAVEGCVSLKIPFKILTKCTDWIEDFDFKYWKDIDIAFGFTLTGHDELEPGASTNMERIAAIKTLHDAGFKTWASIEPIIDFESSLEMIKESKGFCDLYKIGLQSGKKYHKMSLQMFMVEVHSILNTPIYWKDTLLQQAGANREDLPENCVTRDYNLFNP